MNTKHFHTSPLGAFKTLTGVVVLGGALYGLTLSPAYSQPTPPASPAGAPADDLRPINGKVKVDPQGRLKGGPKDGPEAGPKGGPKAGPRGPRDEKGPRPGGPEGDRDRRGPSGPDDGPGAKGPRPEGPGGPEGRGPGGPEGARPDGPSPEGPGGPDGPRPEGPGGPRGPRQERGPEGAMQRAYRSAGELDRYGQLEGDVLNLTGQARDYYNRAGAALKAGDQAQAEKLARTCEQLTQAALHLARAQKGPLPLVKVAGWDAPPQPKAPAPPAGKEEKQPRVVADLSRRLQDVSAAPVNASWVETARHLADQAQKDMDANNPEAGRERAMAAMQLLEAADSHTPAPTGISRTKIRPRNFPGPYFCQNWSNWKLSLRWLKN